LSRGAASSCILLAILSFWTAGACGQEGTRSKEYDALQKRLAAGWNTWDVHSVTTQVLLPAGLAVRMGVNRKTTLNGDGFLGDTLIGRQGEYVEQVFPGAHAWDGSYTDVRLHWRDVDLRVQSAHAGGELVILVTPLAGRSDKPDASAVFSVGYLWNRAGTAERVGEKIVAHGSSGEVNIYCTGAEAPFSTIPMAGSYLARELAGAVGLSTGRPPSFRKIKNWVEDQGAA